jgi:hypothetical protein
MASHAAEAAYDATTIALCAEKGWAVHLTCPACRHRVSWSVAELVEKFPAHITLKAIRERAKCSCGHVGAWVGLTQDKASRLKAWDLDPPKDA